MSRQPDEPDRADDDENYWASHTADGGSFIFDTPDEPPAVWGEGESVGWAQGESLMICGPSGVGKTTLTVQLIEARMGLGPGIVLGAPVRPGTRKVLYLAMDRPPQVSRAMARLFREADRDVIADRLVVWKGPPPYDLAKRPDTLLRMCEQADADTVVVDSLKDGVLKLSEDESGGGYNKARQMVLRAGVEVVEQHHQRKAGGDNKKPSRIDDVYGSVWITAGSGSVMVLWGEPGDPVVELIHLKQPAEPWGPWLVRHDHATGRSVLHHQTDVLALVVRQGHAGLGAKLLAQSLFSTDKPKPAEVEKARRKLEGLTSSGHLVKRPGSGQDAAVYFRAEPEPSTHGDLGTSRLTSRSPVPQDPTLGVTDLTPKPRTAGQDLTGNLTHPMAAHLTFPPPFNRGENVSGADGDRAVGRPNRGADWLRADTKPVCVTCREPLDLVLAASGDTAHPTCHVVNLAP